MKTLKKSQISELKKEMPMLDSKEMKSIIGGEQYQFDALGNLVGGGPDWSKSGISVWANNQTLYLSGSITTETWNTTSGCCLVINGYGVNQDLFTFLAYNTGVEWFYLFNSGSNDGRLITAHGAHFSVCDGTHSNGYENVAHNHGNSDYVFKPYWMTDEEWITYNGLPSNEDINWLIDHNYNTGSIFNKYDGMWHEYTRNSLTQQLYSAELKQAKGIEE